MSKEASRIVHLIHTAHSEEVHEFVTRRSIFGSRNLELIADTINGYLGAMSPCELTSLSWDEKGLHPLDEGLAHLHGPASGQQFQLGLGRAVILRELVEYATAVAHRNRSN